MAAQTGTQFSFAGETQFITALAEVQVRHRPDKTDRLLRINEPKVRRGSIRLELRRRDERTELPLQLSSRFGDGQEILSRSKHRWW